MMKLSKRKDGRWQYNKRINGMCKTFYSSEPTERRAEKDIENQLLSFSADDYHKKHNFMELAKQCLDEKSKTVQWCTYIMYIDALRRLTDDFDTYIEQLSPLTIQMFLEELAYKKYSHSAIHKNKILIGMVYDYAIRQGIQINNPIRSIKMPKNIVINKVKAPDDKIIEKIIEAKDEAFGIWALTLLCTGLRRSEINALQIKDINFEKRTINVWRSVEFLSNQPRLKEMPKTLNSIRITPIIDLLYNPLLTHCQSMNPDDFVFGGEKPLTLIQIRRRWDKYQKLIGCKLNQHQLRHAYAKLLHRSGVDAKTAQHLLGHSSIQITNDIYTDFDNELIEPAAAKLNDYLKL